MGDMFEKPHWKSLWCECGPSPGPDKSVLSFHHCEWIPDPGLFHYLRFTVTHSQSDTRIQMHSSLHHPFLLLILARASLWSTRVVFGVRLVVCPHSSSIHHSINILRHLVKGKHEEASTHQFQQHVFLSFRSEENNCSIVVAWKSLKVVCFLIVGLFICSTSMLFYIFWKTSLLSVPVFFHCRMVFETFKEGQLEGGMHTTTTTLVAPVPSCLWPMKGTLSCWRFTRLSECTSADW